MLENLKFVFYGDQFYVDNFWLMEYSQDIFVLTREYEIFLAKTFII